MKQNAFSQNSLQELIAHEKSTQKVFLLFVILGFVSVIALLVASLLMNLSIHRNLYYSPVLILVFIILNYQNLQKVRQEIKARQKQ